MNAGELLRLTAFHEAGHAIVAEHLTGSSALVSLWRAGTGADIWFRGKCSHAQASPQALRLIALAGAVAEVMAGPHGGNSGAALLNPTLRRISAADAANAGDYSVRDLDECLALCYRLWPSIDARARLEITAFHQREAAGTAAYA